MYDYRNMTGEDRRRVVERRRDRKMPWHSPPHWKTAALGVYFVTGACYEHAPIVGKTPGRMSECEEDLLLLCQESGVRVHAWTVLPNHYHVLAECPNVGEFCAELGKFHGRASFKWNGEDSQRGRQVWYRSFDRAIRSERHFWASVNYIHNNAVHHGYVEKWQDWPWSSAAHFVERLGRAEATRIWLEYPILDFGKKWDI